MSSGYHRQSAHALTDLARMGWVLSGLTADSRQVKPGMAFAAYPGCANDGRRYIAAAIAMGAAAILWEAEGFSWPAIWEAIPNLAVRNLKAHLGDMAALIYGNPSQALWTVGVTGTNGKTSCTQWIAQVLNGLSRKTAIVGTLGNGFPPDLDCVGNTTPDAALLQAALAGYRDAGAAAAVIEVSSHGLDQGRVNGVEFDVAVLTNLSRDHLDYHGDMASYAAVKARLFAWPGLRYAVLNLDDEFGCELAAKPLPTTIQTVGYGFGVGEVRSSQLQLLPDGLAMVVETAWGHGELRSHLLGRFNAHNLLATLAALLVSGTALDDAISGLSAVVPPAGRMQAIGGGDRPLVIIDYAHTPDALEKVLSSLREMVPAGQMWCVFGCGGERDVGKRALMGGIAERLADKVVVTSDNPRSEDAAVIVADIQAGMSGREMVCLDRFTAIAEAVTQAQVGDVILVAGKGHENYQEIAGVKYAFNDLVIARQALESRPCR
ncbi:MAG: UDP-N-acetylmuramoyl-L-alanyl-D-glutamate--2,6-diaminopimelate ligase [Sulfuriferula sp.]